MRNKNWKKTLLVMGLLGAGFPCFTYWYMTKCKGKWDGEHMENQKIAERIEIKKGLERDVASMQCLGPRNSVNGETYANLLQCEGWIRQRWQLQGYSVKSQAYLFEGRKYSNLEIELRGHVSHRPGDVLRRHRSFSERKLGIP
ncbi:MAG: hypothetical protein A2157_12180 [Deltaproteobacteria bacterium RBG_16_47_11]|nr:MAG: hypothetical protein A2157_12180 [Deltaproteobacteria bacterium RBG_16_47_11]